MKTTNEHLLLRATNGPLREILRHWRRARGQSQLELSLSAGVSQRHLSFIESGRSQPSRQMVLNLAQALNMPLRETNLFLSAAGFASHYPESDWAAQELAPVRKALERVLRQHEPWPAVVMDRHWNVLMTNTAAPRFFNHFIDLEQRKGPRNILHLMFDPQGLRPFIVNWEMTAKSLFQRVYRECVGGVIDEKTRTLLRDLASYPEIKPNWKLSDETLQPQDLPMLPVSFMWEGSTLNYFSMVSTLGTPQCVTAQEFRIECLFPADEATEHFSIP
ncbi:MAG: helix-turn-helix transcriptional regulator [Pleurocapsa sp. SU_196_0]|nr:helix-turn-helix transcriptional regulator [Pleurocapsa sp. SU_196_0]